MVVIYCWSSCDLCFLIRTNTCVMKWRENVTSFGIKRNCNWLDLDKASLKLASKNLVCSKLKPRFKIFSVLFERNGFPEGLLRAENIRSAHCSQSKFFISARAWKKSQCSQRPFITPIFLSRQHGIQAATFCHHFLKHIFILQSTDFHFVSFHVVLQITVSHLHCKKEGIKCTRKNKKNSELLFWSLNQFVCLLLLLLLFFSCGHYSVREIPKYRCCNHTSTCDITTQTVQ